MDQAPWLDWFRRHKGEIEFTGKAATDFVKSCFKYTTYGSDFDITPPCCAATLCAALESSGFKSTKSAAAISYEHYGSPCDLKPGAIVVFQFADGGHHVTVCDHIVNQQLVACTGGNQHHEIKTSVFLKSSIIACRWPVPMAVRAA